MSKSIHFSQKNNIWHDVSKDMHKFPSSYIRWSPDKSNYSLIVIAKADPLAPNLHCMGGGKQGRRHEAFSTTPRCRVAAAATTPSPKHLLVVGSRKAHSSLVYCFTYSFLNPRLFLTTVIQMTRRKYPPAHQKLVLKPIPNAHGV